MIKLIKSTFYNEDETKEGLCSFIRGAKTLSMGEQCKKFEEAFAKKQKRKYAVFVNSGSSANLLLLQALLNIGRLQKGDEIGVSSLTWATNIMPIIQLGMVPVLVDCEVETLNISSATLAERISHARLKALFITNTLGLSGNMGAIKKLCDEKGILLLEDNCEALGSMTEGKLLGNFGFASTFSFFVGHHISAIEGGMVCTDDEEFHAALVLSRAHGWDRNLPEAAQKKLRTTHDVDEFYSKYTFYDLGFNVRPTEINGFLGNDQIQYWDIVVSKRERNFKELMAAIERNAQLMPINYAHMDVVSSFAVPVICKEKKYCEALKKKFIAAEVEIRPMIAGNMERQPFFKKYVKHVNRCPSAEFLHGNSFYFGNNPELVVDEIDLLANLIQ